MRGFTPGNKFDNSYVKNRSLFSDSQTALKQLRKIRIENLGILADFEYTVHQKTDVAFICENVSKEIASAKTKDGFFLNTKKGSSLISLLDNSVEIISAKDKEDWIRDRVGVLINSVKFPKIQRHHEEDGINYAIPMSDSIPPSLMSDNAMLRSGIIDKSKVFNPLKGGYRKEVLKKLKDLPEEWSTVE